MECDYTMSNNSGYILTTDNNNGYNSIMDNNSSLWLDKMKFIYVLSNDFVYEYFWKSHSNFFDNTLCFAFWKFDILKLVNVYICILASVHYLLSC